MKEFFTKFREARKKKDLTIQDVSVETKIRPHIIEAIEKGNIDILPMVYMKAFLKTYSKFLNIPFSEVENVLSEQKEESDDTSSDPGQPQDNEKIKQPKATPPPREESSNDVFKKIFQNKAVDLKKINYLNVVIYIVIGVVVVLALYFTFFSDSGSGVSNSGDTTGNITTITVDDTVKKKKDKNLLEYFEPQDSLILTAEAKGESWIRIEPDGKRIDEVLLKPGMKRRWTADEFFILTQGNVGSVIFKRNGQKLEPFGNPGTVVKNIKITEDKVMNTNPINKNQSRSKVKRGNNEKKKRKLPKQIEPSVIPKNNNIRQENDSGPERF